MNITLVEITPDYCVETEGRYVVRTASPNPGLRNNRLADNFHFLEATVYRHWDEKNKKWVMKIDVNNQIPTHISLFPSKLVNKSTRNKTDVQIISADEIKKEAQDLYPKQKSSSDPTVEVAASAGRKAYVKGALVYVDGAMRERNMFRQFLTESGNLEIFKKWTKEQKEI